MYVHVNDSTLNNKWKLKPETWKEWWVACISSLGERGKKIIKSLRINNDQTLKPKDKVIILLIGLRLQTASQPLLYQLKTQFAALSFKFFFFLFDYFITFFNALAVLYWNQPLDSAELNSSEFNTNQLNSLQFNVKNKNNWKKDKSKRGEKEKRVWNWTARIYTSTKGKI